MRSFIHQITEITPPTTAAFQKLDKRIDVGTALSAPDYACTSEIDEGDLVLRKRQ